MPEEHEAPPEPTGMPAGAEGTDWRAPGGFPWPPVVLILAFVVLSAVVIGYRITRPAPSGPKVLTDQTFVAQANERCRVAIPALRPQDTSRDSSVTPDQIAEGSIRAAAGLAALATELRALPVAAEQKPFVEGWLDGWAAFIDAGRRYAQAVRTGDIDAANEIGRSGDPAQKESDAFARGNGLNSCLLQSAIRKPRGASGGGL